LFLIDFAVDFGFGVLIAVDFHGLGWSCFFAFLVNIRRDQYIVDAKKKKKF
jgi:Holliday junction resolvase